jgi:membrane protease YdiL (CAAX protease family)
MEELFAIITAYLARIGPGLALGTAMLFLALREPRLRVVLYLALFVLLRDAMTPLGLWSFGRDGFFWIRLHSDRAFLVSFGLACLGLALALFYLDRGNRTLVQWTRGSPAAVLLYGLAGCLLVIAPLAAIYQVVPVESRGGSVDSRTVPAILIFAVLGNLLEELLFRGYVYGWLARSMHPIRAGAWSGVVFAFCHIFLATTVTSVGYPLLAFTLWEGVVAGLVGARAGVLPATITHGGAIFFLSSGLF